MSDFDKFFAEKLEEEAHYPGRAKNWRSLNQRLDAFVVGSSVGSAVGSVAWKAVSAVLLVTTAVLVWQYAGLQKEHGQMQQQQQKLEQQIAELQRPAAQQQDVNPQIAKHQQPADQQPQQNLEQQVAELQRQTARQSKQQQYLEQQIAQLRQQAAGQSKSSQSLAQQIAEPQQPVAQQPSNATGSAVAQSTASQGAGVPPIFPEKKGDTVGAEKPGETHATAANSTIPQHTGTAPSQTDTARAVQPNVAQPIAESARHHPDSTSSAVATVPAAAATPDSTAKTAQVALPDTSAKSAQATVPPPIIKPLRQCFQLKAGMGAIVGWEQPRQQGISLITGQGISASLSLWRSRFWLTSGVDWVRFEEKSSAYRPELHPFAQPPKSPKPGPGPHPHDELVSVESQQRQQRYHLGLRYALPQLLGVRPTLHAGHVWARTAPTFVQYTFDDHDPGGPNPNPNHKLDFLTQKEGPIKYSNIWQAGLGLEYDLRAWTLSLQADYQAQVSAATNPTFDALFLQAGLEYSIR